ncbi:hypothetical protein P3S67_007856 [Capsicum chacoense]
MVVQASQVYFKIYPTVKKTVSEWLAVCPIKACFGVDVPKNVEQPHTLNDLAFQEDDSQIHEIDIDENEIPNTLNDPDGMFIDMEEDEDKDEDDDDDNNDDDDDKVEEEECELHKKKIRRI